MGGRSKDKARASKEGDSDAPAEYVFIDRPRFIEHLKGQRSKNYTRAQQIRLLRHIAQQSLDWWGELVNARQGKGTGAARESYLFAMQELERLERLDGVAGDNSFEWAPSEPDTDGDA